CEAYRNRLAPFLARTSALTRSQVAIGNSSTAGMAEISEAPGPAHVGPRSNSDPMRSSRSAFTLSAIRGGLTTGGYAFDFVALKKVSGSGYATNVPDLGFEAR